MKRALDEFENSMRRARTLHELHLAFSNRLTDAVDLSDILRAEIAMAVSAFDFFVHELTRLGMLECFVGKRPPTDAFGKWKLSLSAVAEMDGPSPAEHILDSEIRRQHRFNSFQQPERVADAVRLFSNVRLWEEVARECGEGVEDAKRSFGLIIDRRNKIVHEADIDPSYPGQLWPIDRSTVEILFDRIEAVARAIYRVSI